MSTEVTLNPLQGLTSTLGPPAVSTDNPTATAAPGPAVETSTKPPEAAAASSAETKPVENKPDAELAKQRARFQVLAKQERALQQARMQTRVERERVRSEAQQVAREKAEIQRYFVEQNRTQMDPLDAVQDATAAELEAMRAEIRNVRRSQQIQERNRIQDDQRRLMQENRMAVQRFQQDVMEHIQGNPEQYELINLQKQYGLVNTVVEENFRRTKRIMPIAEAAKLVEGHLEEQTLKAIETKKLKSKLAPKAAEVQSRQSSGSVRTLSNDLTAVTHASPTGLTDRERFARASAAIDAVVAKGS